MFRNIKTNKIISILIMWVIIIVTLLVPFINILNSTNKINNSSLTKEQNIEWGDDELPGDFFGDWSYPEFWEDGTTHKIIFDDPQSTAYYHYEAYTGIGLQATRNYTSKFNNAINDGYIGLYTDEHYGSSVKDNLDGWWCLNPNWILNDVLYYMEDWLVWNWNENLHKGEGVDIDNMDASISTYLVDSGGFDAGDPKGNIYIYESNIDAISVGGLSSHSYGCRLIMFNDWLEEWPIPDYHWEKDSTYNMYYYHTNPLKDYSISPEIQSNINDGRIEEDKTQSYIHNSFKQSTSFNEFKSMFETKLLLALNEEYDGNENGFIPLYGEDQLTHDRLQGIKSKQEDIRLDDFNITYTSDVNDNEITDNKELSEYGNITINIKTNINDNNSWYLTEGEISTELDTSTLPIDWTPIDPSDVDSKNLLWLWITIGTFLIVSIVFIILFVKLKKGK